MQFLHNHIKHLRSLSVAAIVFASISVDAAKFDEMDYGPVMATTADLNEPDGNMVLKGLAISLQAATPSPLTGPIGNGEMRKSKSEVEGTEQQAIYGTQREGTDGYLLHVPKGTYDVTLLFAEIWRKKPGYRVSDVYLQDNLVLEDFDVAKEVDRFVKLDKTFKNVKVDSYHLTIGFKHKTRYKASIAGIIIKGANGFEKKINFGGAAVDGFEAGWGEEEGVADPYEAGAVFDTELLRWGGGWVDGYLVLRGTLYDDTHGPYPAMTGTQLFGASAVPGWMPAGTAPGSDPRTTPAGRLPNDWGQYVGLYHNGKIVTVEMNVLAGRVLERMHLEKVTGTSTQTFIRTINAKNLGSAARVLLAEAPANAKRLPNTGVVAFDIGDGQVFAVGASAGKVSYAEGAVKAAMLDLPGSDAKIAAGLWRGPAADLPKFEAFIKNYKAADLTPATAPKERVWAEDVVTQGKLHDGEEAAYVVDTVTLPEDNPWKAWMRPTAIDFYPGGKKAAIATWSGDVWTVDGLGGDLAELKWQRVAAGLYHPLGLKIINDKIYVNGRDQITLLEDRNNDGEADFYRNFNNDVKITNNFHEFSFGLHTDKDGWLYMVKAGPVKHGGKGFAPATEHNGAMMRVSPDGKKLETFATGFRAPNGMSIGPNGIITTSDNEGTNMPTTPINHVVKDGFYGVKALAHRDPIPKRNDPICWIPHDVDNSGGGQVWVTSKKWGPFEGELLHLSYGTCRVMHVMKEEIGDTMQGGVAFFNPAGRIGSGIMRGQFSEADGQLYVGGIKGWQTRALYDGGMYRIRYTGKKLYRPVSLEAGQNGLRIRFSEPIDKASAEDAGNYSIEQWTYSFTEAYGSAHYLPSDPTKKGKEELDVRSVTVIDDRTIFLETPNIAPVLQMQISLDIKAADGNPIKHTVWNSVHKLGDWKGESKAVVANAARTDLKPGLLLKTRVTKATDWLDARISRLAALHVPAATPVSSRFAKGTAEQPFEAEFTGWIRLKKKQTVKFSFAGAGRAILEIDGAPILDATGDDLKTAAPREVSLKKGDNAIRVRYIATKKDATVRLYWESDAFPREPIPATSLVHDPADELLQASQLINRGRHVFAENNCAACHGDAPVGPNAMPEATAFGPNLTGAGSRLTGKWLAAWLRNPQHVRPGTNMPSVINKLPEDQRDQAASDLAAFVDSLVAPAPQAVAGNAANGKKLYEALGCASCHTQGEQTDPTKISLALANDKFEAGALTAFLKNPNAHDPANRMPDFALSAQEAADLAASLRAESTGKLQVLPLGDAAKGKALYEKMNCAACHTTPGIQPGKQLASLFGQKKDDSGCLTGALNDPNHTRFFINEADRNALSAFLKTDASALDRDPVAEFATRKYEELNCTACHARDDMQSGWNAEAGKGIPALHFVGEKLELAWMADFIGGKIKAKPRPWLKSRMPGFPADADRLAAGLAAEHGFGEASDKPEDESTNFGKDLLGATGGFACIICHGVGSEKAMAAFEAPGINLQTSGERLRHEFYLRWMIDPKRVDQQTKMPKFTLPGGKTALNQYHEGDAQKQFDAIFNYLKTVK